jgi:hypothetical protein
LVQINAGGEQMALEDVLLPLLFWGSPIGLGIFFIGLGYLIKSAALAARGDKTKNQKDT